MHKDEMINWFKHQVGKYEAYLDSWDEINT